MCLVVLCFGANTLFARLAVGEVSPMMVVTLRWALVLLLLIPLASRSLRNDWDVIRNHIGLFLALGAVGFALFNALYYLAAHTTSALNLGIVQGTMPALVLLGARFLYGEPIRAIQALGVAVTLVGVAVVASAGSLDTIIRFAFRQGDILVFLACVIYAGYTLWLRRRPDVAALSQFAVMAAGAFLASLPLTALEWSTGNFQPPTATGWVIVLLIALFPSLLAQVLFIRAVQVIGPVRATMFVNLVPVIASIFAVTFLGETFSAYHGIALGLVLGGIYLSERTKASATPAAAADA